MKNKYFYAGLLIISYILYSLVNEHPYTDYKTNLSNLCSKKEGYSYVDYNNVRDNFQQTNLVGCVYNKTDLEKLIKDFLEEIKESDKK